jgi:hypothetical protein
MESTPDDSPSVGDQKKMNRFAISATTKKVDFCFFLGMLGIEPRSTGSQPDTLTPVLHPHMTMKEGKRKMDLTRNDRECDATHDRVEATEMTGGQHMVGL